MGSLPKSAARTLVDELSKALASLEQFYEAALEAQRRQERQVAGDVWSSIDDMRVAADRADTALLAAHLLLPESVTSKVLAGIATALDAWSLALEEFGDPHSSLRNPFDKRTVTHALAESCLWILVVRRALHSAERAQAGSEVSS